MFKKVIKHLTKPRVKYEPLVKVLISEKALLHNYETYQQTYPYLKIAPVLKSNAYGHGLKEVGRVTDAKKPPFLVVDSFYEALVLRRADVKSKILIIGYARQDVWGRKTLANLAYTISSFPQLREISKKLMVRQVFHLKIDTGMHRQGILPAELAQATSFIKSSPNIVLEGLCSHFANAYSSDPSFTKKQISEWNHAVEFFRAHFPNLRYFHTAATAGVSYSREIYANVARIGIGLYGINTAPFGKMNLKPALEMRSLIGSIKQIPAGEKIGYNLLFESQKPMTIGTVPLGYNEGIDLRLTNKGLVKIAGKDCPIIGRISMNVTTIDISKVENPNLEQEVVIISRDRDDLNSIENIAKICNTSPYEILIHINPSLHREII